jgi:hypothetical protein
MAKVIRLMISNRDAFRPRRSGINAERNAADRSHEKADAEGCDGQQQRGVLTFRRKE